MSARDALAALYHAGDGAHWRANNHWLSGSVCRWHGIECDGSGEVTSIDLGGNGVHGTLPSQLASLAQLKVLNIDESRLSGTLPAKVGSLSKLETILLASNPKLSGTLSASVSEKLSVLDLSLTKLSGTISGLTRLSALQRLQLDHTQLSGTVPSQLGTLRSAQAIYVHASSRLSGSLPTELGSLGHSLWFTSFASTRISGTIPTEIGLLTHLRSLWLVKAGLSGTLPPTLGLLKELRELEVHGNLLSGTIPHTVGGGSGAGSERLSPLAKSLRRCVLTAAQGPHQPRHSMRPVDREEADSNRFACPLPLSLSLPVPSSSI